MKARHLLVVCVLGLMLALALAVVPSQSATSEASRTASGDRDLGPDADFQVTATGPEPNALTISPTALVSATFISELDPATISTATFPIWGAQTWRYTGTYSLPGSDSVQFAAAAPFKPGEVIVVAASSGIESSSGDSLSRYVWQFTADVAGGSGNFLVAPTYPVGESPNSVAAGDLDGDGDLDLATANLSDGSISVLLNTGDGIFSPQVSYAVGNGPWSLSAGDLDRYGDLDLAVASWSDGAVSVLMGVSPPTCFNPLLPARRQQQL